jgi:uncharacterized membrane protein YdfJ with MMPL/SSD domain
VAAATVAGTNKAGDTAIVAVIPRSGPSTVETKDVVGEIRDLRTAIEAGTGTNILVTGNTAVGIDISAKLAGALPVFLLLVVGLSFVLLTIAFRSLLVPLKATVGFLLSVGATFGALVAVFQWGWLAGDLLALGVLVDAFVVRMTIVPAVMTLLGSRAWRLPRWLDRILPNVDIEGAGLRTDHGPSATTKTPVAATH